MALTLIKRKITNLQVRILPNFQIRCNSIILGIETSCDDTGCAIVNDKRNILGEALLSQSVIHLRHGGVNPIIAYELHRDNIAGVVESALKNASINPQNIDAVAVTVKPGLTHSLKVGVKYANYFASAHGKPLIPIHHMEAHALVARMYHSIPFPFLVLLISGGHCIFAVVKNVNEHLLLGQTLDNAPGEILDKVARRMKLRNISALSNLPGGQAIEFAAKLANNPQMFSFPIPLVRYRDCNFSFSGLKNSCLKKLVQKEFEHKAMGDCLIPEIYDLCASFQTAITKHMMHRIERGVMFCEKHNLISKNNRKLVISGGVACNNFIFNSIKILGNKIGYEVYRPPPKVCTDNGVMIAWNGIEKLKENCNTVNNISLTEIDPKAPFGKDIRSNVINANLQVRASRLNFSK